MYELIKNPNVDWIGLKRYFILFSVALLVIGGGVGGSARIQFGDRFFRRDARQH